MFRLACTVQPKARAAGDTVTVAGSGLTGTHARPKNAPDGDADPAGVPDHQVRRLPHLDLALGARHRASGRSRSAAGYQLRSPASLVSPVRGRMKAGSRQQPGEASARRMGDEAGAAGEQGRVSCRAGTAIGALPSFLRLTVTSRRDGADDHHGITPTRGATDCPVRHGTGQPPRPPDCRPYRRISRDGRDQQSSRCATSVESASKPSAEYLRLSWWTETSECRA